MAIDRDGDGPPLSRDDARAAKPADGLRASPFTEDVFDDEYYGRRRRGGGISFGVIAGIVFVAAVVAVAGWYIMGERGASTAGEGPGLIVKADPSPYKIKPDDPGGMQVDNQDKLIYDRVAKGAPPSRVENLLPAPEEPRAPPAPAKAEPPAPTVPAAPKAVSSTAPAPAPSTPAAAAPAAPKPAAKPDADPMASLMAQVESMKKPATPVDAPTPEEKNVAKSDTTTMAPAGPMLLVPAAPANPEPTESTPVVASASPPPALPAAASPPTSPAQAATTPISAPATGTAFVQLVSVQSQEAAMGEWKRLNVKNSDLLAGLAPTVMQAEVPDKGTYFRLRAGPLTDKAAAEALCAALKSRGVGCNVVRP